MDSAPTYFLSVLGGGGAVYFVFASRAKWKRFFWHFKPVMREFNAGKSWEKSLRDKLFIIVFDKIMHIIVKNNQ